MAKRRRRRSRPARRRRRRSPTPKRAARRRGSKWTGRVKRMGAAAALGFVRGKTTALNALEAKLPAIAGGGKSLALGGVIHLVNEFAVHNRMLGYVGDAALIVGAHEMGRTGFGGALQGEGDDDLLGAGDHIDISGEV